MRNKTIWIVRGLVAFALIAGAGANFFFNVTPAYAAADRYWVGDGGNWSSTSHWSTMDGGASGASVPTSASDVWFTANSFTLANQRVYLAAGDIPCKSLTLTGSGAKTPIFDASPGGSSSTDLSVYGSITWDAGWTCEQWAPDGALAQDDKISIHDTATLTGCLFGSGNGTPRLQIVSGTTTLANNASARAFTKTGGTFDVNGQTFTCGWFFYGGGQTYSGTVVMDNAGNKTTLPTTTPMTGANQFNNLTISNTNKWNAVTLDSNITVTGTLTLTGTSDTNRVALSSNTSGVSRQVTAAVVSSAYCDFFYILAAGAGDWDLSAVGENAIDFGGCSGITFWLPYDGTRDYYWTGKDDGVAGTGVWEIHAVEWDKGAYSWSTTSGGTAGAARLPPPTSGNSVHFDVNSGFTAGNNYIYLDEGSDPAIVYYCKDLDFTGVNASVNPTLYFSGNGGGSDKTELEVYGDLIFVSGVTLKTEADGTGSVIRLKGTGDVTTAGAQWGLDLMGYLEVAGNRTFKDDITFNSLSYFKYTSGTIDMTTNHVTIYYTAPVSGTVYNWTFWGGGQTYYGFVATGTTVLTIDGANTFTNFTRTGGTNAVNGIKFAADQYITNLDLHGYSQLYRLAVGSSVSGTQRQIDVSGTLDVTNCDFSDIAGVGTSSWDISSGNNSDFGNCQGIIFSIPRILYWVGNAGNWSDYAYHWASTSNGLPGTGRVPLIQDMAVFDDNSFSLPGRTVTIDITNLSGIYAEDVSNTPTFSKAGTVDIYGDVTLGTVIWSITTTRFCGFETGISSSSTLTTTFTIAKSPTHMSTLYLGSNITVSGQVVVSSGTFNHNGWDLTASTYDSSTTTYDRAIRMGSGTTTLDSTAATTKWNMASTKLSFFCETSTLKLTNSGANGQTFAGAGLTYNNIMQAGAGAWTMTVSGTNTCYQLKIDRSEANKTISGNVTFTLQDFDLSLSGTRTITITNTDFTKSSGVVLGDYLIISGSSAGGGATFFASVGGHSTNGGGNSGWVWTAPTAPTVATNNATDVTPAGATINGELLTKGSYVSFTCYFEYGPTVAYGYTTESVADILTAIGTFDNRLTPYHPYHYRAVVEFGLNDHAYGNDKTLSLSGAVGQASAAVSDPGAQSGTSLVTAAPGAIPHMYTEGNTAGIPVAPLIDPALSGAGIPEEAFWYPIAFILALVIGFAAYAKTRNLMVQAIVSGVVMAAFCGGGVLGDGLLPYLTVVIFAIEAGLILVIQEKQHV